MKVFLCGEMATWLAPLGTWESLLSGEKSPDNLFIRASDALELFRASAPEPDWNGGESRSERIASEIGDRKLDRQIDQQHNNT